MSIGAGWVEIAWVKSLSTVQRMMIMIKPLFIPLKAEFYNGFEAGLKDTEFRPYGPRWNERTCSPGREVVLSYGYGKQRRIHGVIIQFERSAEPTKTEAWRKCYGDKKGDAACIRIKLDSGQ